jgi:hypothetical protein
MGIYRIRANSGKTEGEREMKSRVLTLTCKRVGLAIGLLLLLTLGNIALADDGPILKHTAPYWQATYWNNTSLWGTPVVQRQESSLNHDWGSGSPHFKVRADHFSARWTRYIDIPPGTYRFIATSDDGVRVWVDSDLIIDQWHDHPPTTYTAQTYIGAGHHLVKVEYYEKSGIAVAQVAWEPLGSTTGSWRAEYYANPRLGVGCMPPVTSTNCRVIVREDPEIDFNWGWGTPVLGMPSDRFSVRWTRTAHFEPGFYRFTTTTDDGVRLSVNEHLLIDNWRDQPVASRSGTIYLEGDVALNMEYYENGGVAVAKLAWEREGGHPAPAAERIRFAPGAISAQVGGSLTVNGVRHYVLRALAGQMMIIVPHTDHGQVRLTISGADGQVLLSGRVGPPGGVYDGILPTTQDYFIRARAHGGTGTNYNLEITIPPL